MRIDNTLPYNNFAFANTGNTPVASRVPSVQQNNSIVRPVGAPAGASAGFVPDEAQKTVYYGQGVIVDISPEARAASRLLNRQEDQDSTKGIGGIEPPKECQTCKNRKYVDDSSDPSVSYQSPAHISPGQSAGKVMAHEREHVTNEQSRADRENRKVVSQTVTLSTSVCPECGRVYVSGGVTRTVTKNDNSAKLTDNINASGGENA